MIFSKTNFSMMMNSRTRSLADGLLRGDRSSLSRSITLVESTLSSHCAEANALLEYVLGAKGGRTDSFRLGVAGPPGAGKSTFIESLGKKLCKDQGKRVAVIAVDPSSSRTGGSILGDKTRMTELAKEPLAYVRPSPTRGTLGGLAQHTNDVILLCEASGYEIIIVETVGLGQSEVMVDETVDMLLLLTPPAAGDELQAVKKGIMEVADMVVVNKADGDLVNAARHAATDYMHALQLMRRKHPSWRPRVKMCSSLHNQKIDEVWGVVDKFRTAMKDELVERRRLQNLRWMWSQFKEQLVAVAKEDPGVIRTAHQMETELLQGKSTPRIAAASLVQHFLENRK